MLFVTMSDNPPGEPTPAPAIGNAELPPEPTVRPEGLPLGVEEGSGTDQPSEATRPESVGPRGNPLNDAPSEISAPDGERPLQFVVALDDPAFAPFRALYLTDKATAIEAWDVYVETRPHLSALSLTSLTSLGEWTLQYFY